MRFSFALLSRRLANQFYLEKFGPALPGDKQAVAVGIVGDAAHVASPMVGAGFSSGLEDGAALCTAVIRAGGAAGRAGVQALRLYNETRLRSLEGYLRLIEKKSFFHQVAIPEGGLVARPSAMHQFCTTHAMPYMTRVELRGNPPSRYIRFCFDDPVHADAFLAEFGGERITIEPR